MTTCCFCDITPQTEQWNPSLQIEGDTKQFPPRDNRRLLATLLVQLEETEEQIDSLQQLRSDLLKEIANAQQHILLKS